MLRLEPSSWPVGQRRPDATRSNNFAPSHPPPVATGHVEWTRMRTVAVVRRGTKDGFLPVPFSAASNHRPTRSCQRPVECRLTPGGRVTSPASIGVQCLPARWNSDFARRVTCYPGGAMGRKCGASIGHYIVFSLMLEARSCIARAEQQRDIFR